MQPSSKRLWCSTGRMWRPAKRLGTVIQNTVQLSGDCVPNLIQSGEVRHKQWTRSLYRPYLCAQSLASLALQPSCAPPVTTFYPPVTTLHPLLPSLASSLAPLALQPSLPLCQSVAITHTLSESPGSDAAFGQFVFERMHIHSGVFWLWPILRKCSKCAHHCNRRVPWPSGK